MQTSLLNCTSRQRQELQNSSSAFRGVIRRWRHVRPCPSPHIRLERLPAAPRDCSKYHIHCSFVSNRVHTGSFQSKHPELVMMDSPQNSRRKSHKVAMDATEPLLSFLPMSILTDSYKTTHYLQYPESRKMVAVRLCVTAMPP